MTLPCVLLTKDAQRHLRQAGARCYLGLAALPGADLYAVDRIEPDGDAEVATYGRGTLLPRGHPLTNATERRQGAFHVAPSEAHQAQLAAAWRDQMLTFEGLRSLVPALELIDGGLVVTRARDHERAGVPEFAAWFVTTRGALAVDIECEPDDCGVTALEPRWPSLDLQADHVLAVGAGTVGTAAVLGLASYGVGRVTLMDPGRLRYHNLKRLPYDRGQVGNYKVDVLAAAVRASWPDTKITPLSLDVVRDAATARALVRQATLVLCTADGVAPRRVASHLAHRAGVDCVLGCVLDDGAVGEVMRLRAVPDHGCLRCRRAALRSQGVLAGADPESWLHRAYGDGFLHKPMTAVGGDLQLVGQATAKTAVATLLNNQGHRVHTLPGETMLIQLRASDTALPYGGQNALDMGWLPATPPLAGCFTCAPDVGSVQGAA